MLVDKDSVIELRDVNVIRGKRRIFSDATLELEAGSIYAIAGPNGAGKTTLLDTITGLIRPTQGTVSLLGQTPPLAADLAKSYLKVLRQDGRPFDDLTVREFITFVEQVDSAEVESCRSRFGLSDELLDQKISSLSGGEAKRLQLLTTVATSPPVVILDEPTTGLDPASRDILWKEIRRLRDNGSTVLLVTHYLEEMDSLADQLIYIRNQHVHGPFQLAELKAELGYVISVSCADGQAAEQIFSEFGPFARREEQNPNRVLICVDDVDDVMSTLAKLTTDSRVRAEIRDLNVAATTLRTILESFEESELK